MDRNFPYVLVVNVEIAELQGLRDKAGEAIRKLGGEPSADLQVVDENEAVFFCFKNSYVAALFEGSWREAVVRYVFHELPPVAESD